MSYVDDDGKYYHSEEDGDGNEDNNKEKGE